MAPHLWRWPEPFRLNLLRWLNSLQWIPGPGEVTFLELAMDYEAWTGSCIPGGPQWDETDKGPMPPSEKGQVLRVAMAVADRHKAGGTVCPGGMIQQSKSLVALGEWHRWA